MSTNWLDNIIGYIAPSVAVRRLRARLAAKYYGKVMRSYEGASAGNRLGGWITAGSSANTEIAGGLTTLRNRSRDLVRNNCYAKRGISVIKSNVIGTGIITQVKGPNPKKADKLDALFHEWAEQTLIDYNGVNDIYGLQSLIMNGVPESGEVLIKKRFVSAKAGLPVPLQLQIIEPDHLDGALVNTKAASGNEVVQGIEVDANGRKVAYHLTEHHPGDWTIYNDSYKTYRVPADQIIQIYDITRAGQLRGVPWLAAAIVKLRDLDEFEDAQLIRQKIAACFTAFVHDADLDSSAGSDDTTGMLGDKVEPGMIEHLPPGKEVTFGTPPGVIGYKEYIATHLTAIAASLGITYEAMTNDYSQVNYSSGRMGWLEFQRNITDWQNRLIIGQFMRPLFKWFIEAANLAGYDTKGVYPIFTTPRREMIDPTKEIPATIKAIRAGLTSLPEAIKTQGGDYIERLNEISATNKLIDKLGLTLDSDPRKVDVSGKTNGGLADEEAI